MHPLQAVPPPGLGVGVGVGVGAGVPPPVPEQAAASGWPSGTQPPSTQIHPLPGALPVQPLHVAILPPRVPPGGWMEVGVDRVD